MTSASVEVRQVRNAQASARAAAGRVHPGVERREGRAVAITVLSPLKPWAPLWLHPLFRTARTIDAAFIARIRQLSFIHFASWAIVGRAWPADGSTTAQRLHQRYLLFESNFNGGWDEYLDAFASDLSGRMRMVWASSYGFPGPRPTGPFRDCIRRNDFGADYYYSAYPEASATMVLAALDLGRRLPGLARRVVQSSAPSFRSEFDGFLTGVQHLLGGSAAASAETRRAPTPGVVGPAQVVTILAPVRLDRVAELQRVLATLPTGEDSPFESVASTHFARWVVLDQLVYEAFGQKPDPLRTPYLLFTASANGDVDGYLHRLRACAGETADAVWGTCLGYPGTRDPERFVRFLSRHRITPTLPFAAYPDATVAEVRESLARQHRFTEFAMRVQGQDAATVVEGFRDTFPADRFPDLYAGGDRVAGRSSLPDRLVDAASTAAVRTVSLAATGLSRLRAAVEGRPRDDSFPAPRDAEVQTLVRGYGREYSRARLLLCRITDGGGGRRWLHDLLPEVEVPPPHQPAAGPGKARVNVAFTFAGLRALDVPPESLESFPAVFRDGMASRAQRLGDAGENAPDRWEDPYRSVGDGDGEIHVLIALHAHDDHEIDRLTKRVLAGGGVRRLHQQDGERLPRGREHFGFIDGIGQPVVAGISPRRDGDGDRDARSGARRTGESPVAAGEFILGHPDGEGMLPDAPTPWPLARGATYLVYRKLRQDVPRFRGFLRARAAALGCSEEWLAAKIVGRWRDGTPVELSPVTRSGESAESGAKTNAFGYGDDLDGRRCPIGAHIRRANPRDGMGAADPLVRRHRMLRRGIPYGPALPEGAADDGNERGLLFLALMADIERQFEFVQAEWLNDGNAFQLGDDRDILAGAHDGGAGKMVVQGDPPLLLRGPEPVTRLRGGGYFFLPGISGLRWLAEGVPENPTARSATPELPASAGPNGAGEPVHDQETLARPLATPLGDRR
jgi:Dyp-type peroxidase family